MTFNNLTIMLRAWATGYYPSEAAVELLIAHESWIYRAARYPKQLVLDIDEESGLAVIDWGALGRKLKRRTITGSSGELAILAIACSIGGGVGVDLRDALGSMDRTNVGLTIRAVAHAGGYPELAGGTGETL